MPQSTAEKKDRFARMFPPRIYKVIDQFRMIQNCSNKSNYEWNRNTVAKIWVHILEAMREAAEHYELRIDFTINGKALWEVSESGTIESLFEETQPKGDSQAPLF